MARSRSHSPRSNMAAEQLLGLYRCMVRIRCFEERTAELFREGVVKGTAHSSIGQEAIAAGVCLQLRTDDYVGSHHRGHGHFIAKGASMERMMAELMGRETGYCGGLGGSMHIADIGLGFLGANGVVAAAMPLGAGAALAAKMRETDQVVIAFFGDGASNQGAFHETINLAAVWNLPIVFVCENNGYALNTSFRATTAVEHIAERAAAYGITGTTIDGNDVVEVHQVIGDAIERVRGGGGPALIEATTWRWGAHSMRANLIEPRSDEDIAAGKAGDPIARLDAMMLEQDAASRADLDAIRAEAETEMDTAVAAAGAGPEPTADSLAAAVYAPHNVHVEPTGRGARELTYAEALNEAITQSMEHDPSVFMMGEDVGLTGGIFQVTKGLLDKFGPARVRDTPISEAAFCGAGVGAAIAGMRPIVEVQIFDFVTQMMDMIVNQAAKYRYMMGGATTVPIVIRGPQGGGIRLAAQHSQSLEAWFLHVPGLVVIAPSNPYDAKGLLVTAIRDDNPVVFLEHKMLYLGQTMPVPEELYAIPLGKAAITRAGKDATIVATQVMVQVAQSAARQLEQEGIDAEIIDPRTLWPLDEETIIKSVEKTNRLVVVHEAWRRGGFGAEVTAMVVEKAFDHLDAPIERVGAPDVPMPFNDALERWVIPSQNRIVEAVKRIV